MVGRGQPGVLVAHLMSGGTPEVRVAAGTGKWECGLERFMTAIGWKGRRAEEAGGSHSEPFSSPRPPVCQQLLGPTLGGGLHTETPGGGG